MLAKNIIKLAALPIVIATLIMSKGCSKEGPVDSNLNDETTYARLQNQIDHSGIMVHLLELNRFVITDSMGGFAFDNLADGTYTLQSKYPYFRPEQITVQVEEGNIQTPVSLELKQQLQFWIEPAETTISMSNLGSPDFFSLTGFRQYRANITNAQVNVNSILAPADFQAFVPKGFDWPYVPNPDNLPDFCYDHYGWLGGSDLPHIREITFQPGDTSFIPVGTACASKNCFQVGTYLFFSAVSDLGHYLEYFDPAYAGGYKEADKKLLYDKMNRSLIKKRELFRPATVNITN